MNETLRSKAEHVLRTEIAPALEIDGSGLEVVEVDDGIASVRLGPVCAGCPATVSILITQLEAELKTRMPEIEMLLVVN